MTVQALVINIYIAVYHLLTNKFIMIAYMEMLDYLAKWLLDCVGKLCSISHFLIFTKLLKDKVLKLEQ